MNMYMYMTNMHVLYTCTCTVRAHYRDEHPCIYVHVHARFHTEGGSLGYPLQSLVPPSPRSLISQMVIYGTTQCQLVLGLQSYTLTCILVSSNTCILTSFSSRSYSSGPKNGLYTESKALLCPIHTSVMYGYVASIVLLPSLVVNLLA